MNSLENTKYIVKYTSRFKKEFKKMLKQGKDENKFLDVLNSKWYRIRCKVQKS